MTSRYIEPEYRVGAQFMNFEFPHTNALTEGITGGPPARMYGTDPAGYARETMAARFGIPESVKSGAATVGRAVAGSLLALIIVAVGLWVVVKQ